MGMDGSFLGGVSGEAEVLWPPFIPGDFPLVGKQEREQRCGRNSSSFSPKQGYDPQQMMVGELCGNSCSCLKNMFAMEKVRWRINQG